LSSEALIRINNSDPVQFFGVNNSNIQLLQKKYPQTKFIVRGTDIKIIGTPEDLKSIEEIIKFMEIHLERFGSLTHSDIEKIFNSDLQENEFFFEDQGNDELILLGVNKKRIKARTVSQKKMLKSIAKNDMLFAIGPAGTGKTYTAVALAVKALRNKEAKKIILTRPAVEAGESLGFLPGDLRDKLDPYLQPLYDALQDMIPHKKLLDYFETKTIEIAPLAFMRGRTLDNAFVILDEAQNASIPQLKMFLTRMGKSAKFIITGDITQIDLPRKHTSGLLIADKLLANINGIDFIYLNEKDVVRHKLVSKIIKAFEKDIDTEL
jgi:phosphate starvation-inducible PhoH-like protein